MSRLPRILIVTAGLMVSGALIGACCTIAALLAVLTFTEGPRIFLEPKVYLLGGEMGSIIGAVGAPVFGFGLLRNVPLGKALAWTGLGAFAGGVLGWLAGSIGFRFAPFGSSVAGALIGFGTAAVVARITTRGRPREIASGEHMGRD